MACTCKSLSILSFCTHVPRVDSFQIRQPLVCTGRGPSVIYNNMFAAPRTHHLFVYTWFRRFLHFVGCGDSSSLFLLLSSTFWHHATIFGFWIWALVSLSFSWSVAYCFNSTPWSGCNCKTVVRVAMGWTVKPEATVKKAMKSGNNNLMVVIVKKQRTTDGFFVWERLVSCEWEFGFRKKWEWETMTKISLCCCRGLFHWPAGARCATHSDTNWHDTIQLGVPVKHGFDYIIFR